MNNKITLELTPEQYEMVKKQLECQEVEKLKKSPFDRTDKGEKYYCISCNGNISKDIEIKTKKDSQCYETANYCTDRDLLQQQAYRETLNRLLWRFSMQNGGDKIDWENNEQYKYYIYKNYMSNSLQLDVMCHSKDVLAVYFVSREIAQRAIDEIIKPFCENHPDFEF